MPDFFTNFLSFTLLKEMNPKNEIEASIAFDFIETILRDNDSYNSNLENNGGINGNERF